jgi:hypothetical protein
MAWGITPRANATLDRGLAIWLLVVLLVCCARFAVAAGRAPAVGPLKVHPQNGRYFATPDGRAILLTGSHTWETVQDIADGPGLRPFDYEAFLAMCERNGHNFIRLWHWEQPLGAGWSRSSIRFAPLPWARTGPGLAADGGPKFDLDRFDESYFSRLRERVLRARDRGFYVSVMLFQGWSLKKTGGKGLDPFASHPFNGTNNVNGVAVTASTEDSDSLPTLHSLRNPKALAYQEAYVRKVIDAVNDLDNVLYEIINEGGALDWQRHVIRFVKDVERGKPTQHPVGFTHRISPRMWNDDLFASEADWISPAKEPLEWMYLGSSFLQHYEQDPPAADGRKVVLLDTDHLWGHGGTAHWAWKAVCRGHNPIFMDAWRPIPGEIFKEDLAWFWDEAGRNKNAADYPDWAPLRAAMGDARGYAQRMELARAVPRGDLSSTRYCLSDVGRTYLVFSPDGGRVTLDLRRASATFHVEWWHPTERRIAGQATVEGDDYRVLEPPFPGAAVLWLERRP